MPYHLGVNALKHLVYPVFNVLLGVNPWLVGTLHMVIRLWDAFLDPVIGSWSDHCRSRFGRRKPFIAVGCVAGALLFPLIWWVPSSATPAIAAGWFLVTGLLFYTSFAVFSVPYISLSFELSSDYDERTRIAAGRILCATAAALLISWSFHIAQWEWFGSPFAGMRILGIVMGTLYLVGGLPSALFLRERYQDMAKRQPRASLVASAREALGNRSLRVLLGVTILMVIGVNTFEAFTFYVNTYHVFGGDLKRAALYQGFGSSIAAGAALFAVPAVTWLSGRIGKAPAAMVCLGCGTVASASKWFLFTPEHPHWQLAWPILMAPCAGGFWALMHSMKADVCDEEELRTGQRREGMIESVSAWTHKTTVAVTFGLSGAFLVFTGFDQVLGHEQSPDTIRWLRLFFSAAPGVLFIASIGVISCYRLDRAAVERIRTELDQRHAGA